MDIITIKYICIQPDTVINHVVVICYDLVICQIVVICHVEECFTNFMY